MVLNNQYGCPVGAEGRDVIDSMNIHHFPLTDWALSKLPAISPKRILDIGCGGGMLINKLGSMYPASLIEGIDVSEEAVKATMEYNAGLYGQRRLNVQLASVSEIPFDRNSFDLITAVETYFFWPNPELDIFGVAERLVIGGVLMIVSEAYPHPDFEEVNCRHESEYGMKLLSNERMVDIMSDAGLNVQQFTIEENNWVVFIGYKS